MASLAIGISRKLLRSQIQKRGIMEDSTDLSSSLTSSSNIRGSETLQIESTFLLLAKKILVFLWTLICSIFAQFGFLPTPNREKVGEMRAAINSTPSSMEKKVRDTKNTIKNDDELLIIKQLVDGYFLRSKALLAASRPLLAKKVVSILSFNTQQYCRRFYFYFQ